MYNGKSRYKSSIGGLFSLVLICAILTIIIVYLNDFFSRKKAKMTFENIKNWSPPLLDISSDFDFIVMTQFEGENELRDDLFKIDAFYIQKSPKNWVRNKVSSIPCVSKEPSLDKLFNQLELHKGKCFNMSGIVLQGSRITDPYQYFQIKISFIENGLPKDELESLLDTKKPLALVYYVDTAFQITNNTSRYKKFFNNIEFNITYQDTKETTIYFSNNELHVDTNYFFPSTPSKLKKFMIDSTRDLVSVKTENSLEALSVNFVSSKKTEITYISYMQISELLTNICALANVLIISISSVGNYFNHYLFQSDLINVLYEVNSKAEQDKSSQVISIQSEIGKQFHKLQMCSKIYQKKTSENNKPPGHANSTINMFNLSKTKTKCNRFNQYPISTIDQSNLNIDTNTNSYTIQEKIKQTRFSRCDIIKLSIMPLSCLFRKTIREKKIMFKILSKSLMLYQDLGNVYRKMQEVDVLKYLLLTDEQLALYQVIPKPDFKKVNELYNTNEFASLVNQPKFHFLKSKLEVERVLQNPELKTLLVSKMRARENPIDEKLIKLINKQY